MNKAIIKFGHEVTNFIVLDNPADRVGIIFEFKFGNGLIVSVADHSGIDHNGSHDLVSVALKDARTEKIIHNNQALDLLFQLVMGVNIFSRDAVKPLLDRVKAFSILDAIEVARNEKRIS